MSSKQLQRFDGKHRSPRPRRLAPPSTKYETLPRCWCVKLPTDRTAQRKKKTCIRNQSNASFNGLKVDRAKTIAKLPPERQAWLQKELRRWPQLLDHNLDLLAKLADPECPGSNEHTVRLNGRWEPQLAVAYDFSIDRMA